MKKGKNTNHPVKGSSTKVEPIKSLKDIASIKKLLKDNPLHLAIFVVGINTSLRASDLLNLKVGQVRQLNPMDDVEIKEKKTGKYRRISFNKPAVEAIQNLLEWKHLSDNDFLFTGRRQVYSTAYVNNLIKLWCRLLHLQGNYGSHTLRKTFGYIQRTRYKAELPQLMELFGHSSERNTLIYLCIQKEETRNIYANPI